MKSSDFFANLGPTKRLIWIDLETFGLDPASDPIIEIGIAITDLNLEIITGKSWLVWEASGYGRRLAELENDTKDRLVLDMHNKSGLWEAAASSGWHPVKVERDILSWLSEQNLEGKDPMVGSSVHFDRAMLKAQMPGVESMFSHRNIDGSSLKELCLRLNPDLYAKIREDLEPQRIHRARPDLEDSIGEMKWYIENFLFIDPFVATALASKGHNQPFEGV